MIKRLRLFLFDHTSAGQTIIKNTFWLSFSQLIRKFIKLAIEAARASDHMGICQKRINKTQSSILMSIEQTEIKAGVLVS